MIRESPQAQNLWVEMEMCNILLASCATYQLCSAQIYLSLCWFKPYVEMLVEGDFIPSESQQWLTVNIESYMNAWYTNQLPNWEEVEVVLLDPAAP